MLRINKYIYLILCLFLFVSSTYASIWEKIAISFLKDFELNIFPVTEKNGVNAIDWNLSLIDASNITTSRNAYNIILKTYGLLPTENINNIANNINIEATVFYTKRYKIKKLPNRLGNYYFYYGLSPFHYETNKDKTVENTLLSPYIRFDFPFTDIIPYYWIKLFNVKESSYRSLVAQPIKIKYVYSSSYKNIDRLDRNNVEIAYNMSIASNIFLDIKTCLYAENKQNYKYDDVTFSYPLTDKFCATWKNVSGRLPPNYQYIKTSTIGFNLSY